MTRRGFLCDAKLKNDQYVGGCGCEVERFSCALVTGWATILLRDVRET